MRSLAAGKRDALMTAFLWISSVAHMARRSFGKKHTGVVSTSFRNTFSSLQLCRVFHWGCAQQNSSPGCHQLSEVAGEKGRRFNSPSPCQTALLASSWQQAETSIPFPTFVKWQPKQYEKQRDVLSGNFQWSEVVQGLLYIFLWKITNFYFLKVSVQEYLFFVSAASRPAATILPLCGTSLVVCTPSNRWQP